MIDDDFLLSIGQGMAESDNPFARGFGASLGGGAARRIKRREDEDARKREMQDRLARMREGFSMKKQERADIAAEDIAARDAELERYRNMGYAVAFPGSETEDARLKRDMQAFSEWFSSLFPAEGMKVQEKPPVDVTQPAPKPKKKPSYFEMYGEPIS
jgi:hypothetical protein